MECRLFDQLYQYGLEFLVPTESQVVVSEDLDPTDDRYYDYLDYESDNHSHAGYYDDDGNLVYDDEEEYEDEYEDDDDMLADDDDDNFGSNYQVKYLCELRDIFQDFQWETDEDFFNHSLWELFEITKNQLSLVPWQHIPDYSFADFYICFKRDLRSLPVEKRLLYAAVQAITGYEVFYSYCGSVLTKNEVIDYCERIIDHHDFDDAVHLIQVLEDYYRSYSDALEMNRRREAANEPTFKYVPYPKPTHLQDLHDKAFRDHVAMETERMAEDEKQLNSRIATVSETSDYKQFLFKNSEFTVLPVTCQQDLVEEGTALHHCVASYGSYMASGNSYIFRIRENTHLDSALYTAEIIPEDRRLNKKPKLKQCYGYKDTTQKTESLRKFIKMWAQKCGFNIVCKI